MTKHTKLLVGVACAASLFSTPALAAGSCEAPAKLSHHRW